MTEKSEPRVVLVGHCGPDSYALRSAIGSALPGARIEFANEEDAAQRAAAGASLMLINREPMGDFSSDGLGLIAKLGRITKVMLISNYADAQADAERAGALPGFGKKSMYAEDTRKRLIAALADSSRA